MHRHSSAAAISQEDIPLGQPHNLEAVFYAASGAEGRGGTTAGSSSSADHRQVRFEVEHSDDVDAPDPAPKTQVEREGARHHPQTSYRHGGLDGVHG